MADGKDKTIEHVEGGAFFGAATAGRDMAGRDIVHTDVDEGLTEVLRPLYDLATKRGLDAEAAVKTLEAEAAKGKQANDTVLGHLIEKVVELVPDGVAALVGAFASPLLAFAVGPVTRFVLDKLRAK